MKEQLPAWVLKYKQKGTQIIKIKNNYYLYKISSRWDPKKKRSVKITEKYLGKISEEGMVAPKHERIKKNYEQISVKEFGATFFIQSISQEILDNLKTEYSHEWKEIFSLAVFRLTEKSPLKRFSFYYENSFLSESIKKVRVSQKFLGDFLRCIGSRRELMKNYMRSFMADSEYGVIDLTNIFSHSRSVLSAVLGHNKDKVYAPQVNMILIYSLDKIQPVYFRQVPGSIRDVSTIIKTIHESHAEKFILIGDKGFHSDDNVLALQDHEIDYILPLKRNSKYISYAKIITGNKRKFEGYFVYARRHVWYYSEKINKMERVVTYLDDGLKAEEENDLAIRIKHLESKAEEKGLTKEEKEKLENYKKRLFDESYKNGTLSVRTALNKSAEQIYQIMKSRVDIEQAFDTFKNTLEVEKSYMRDDKQLHGWLFVNFIAMQIYYKIYAILLQKNMLNNYSPIDIITYLKRVQKLRAKDEWLMSETPKKTREIIKKLGIEIPIT